MVRRVAMWKPPAKADRNAEIYRKYVLYGKTQVELAAEYELSQGRISEILAAVAKEREGITANQMVEGSRELLNDLQARLLALADMNGAPVTSGKDGDVVVDPDTGEVVRDYGGVLAAIRELRATDAERAKRFGLNAPEKIQSESTVRYEVVGLNDADLS